MFHNALIDYEVAAKSPRGRPIRSKTGRRTVENTGTEQVNTPSHTDRVRSDD